MVFIAKAGCQNKTRKHNELGKCHTNTMNLSAVGAAAVVCVQSAVKHRIGIIIISQCTKHDKERLLFIHKTMYRQQLFRPQFVFREAFSQFFFSLSRKASVFYLLFLSSNTGRADVGAETFQIFALIIR